MKVMICNPPVTPCFTFIKEHTLYVLRVVGVTGKRKGYKIMTFMTHMTRPPGGATWH